jgi:hypothetical protein
MRHWSKIILLIVFVFWKDLNLLSLATNKILKGP